MKTVYAIPNYECNLSCPHCELKERHCAFDHDRFFSRIQNLDPTDMLIIFGGEPTLYEDRLLECLKSKQMLKTVSTNLLNISEDIWKAIFDSHTQVATSWNLTRFDTVQYQKWLQNLGRLHAEKCMVMVTLTDDLIADRSYSIVLQALADIDKTEGCDKLLFEHYVGDYATEDYNKRCDEWLCRIHADWKFSMENTIETRLKNGWKLDCSGVMTIQPDGSSHNGCPQSIGKKISPCMKCLTCEFAHECQPCRLQHSCSRLSNLMAIIKSEQT